MTRSELTRDEARQAFADAGLTYNVINKETLQRLRALINQHMADSGCFRGTFRCWQRGLIRITQWGIYAEIKCRSDYWDSREAVSFNTDGFIGFAGWADNQNTQPVLSGFMAWVKELTAKS